MKILLNIFEQKIYSLNTMATQACNRCTRIPYALFQIFSFSALTATITCVILAYHMYNVWKADWKNQRCKLHVMPFASIIQPNKSVVDNYKECMKMKIDPIIKAHTKYKMDQKVAQSLRENAALNKQAQNTAKDIEQSKGFLDKQFQELVDFFNRIVFVGKYTAHKIQNFFYKIVALIWSNYYFLITNINTVILQIANFQRMFAVMNSLAIIVTAFTALFPPLLPVTILMTSILVLVNLAEKSAQKKAYCCFSSDSKFLLHDLTEKNIESIPISQKLYGNGIVTGKIVMLNNNTNVYNIGNVLVTGDHLVQTNIDKSNIGKWYYAKDLATLYNKNHSKTNYLHCLVTSNNILFSSDLTMFTDYEETSSPNIQTHIAKVILKSLREKHSRFNLNKKYELGEKNNCLPPNTYIKMNDNNYSTIDNIQIGDVLHNNNKVIGKYECDTNNIEFFKLNNIIISPRIICSNNGSDWDKVYNIGKPCLHNFSKGYHLITENHIIMLSNDLVIRDFIETNDEIVQNHISNIVLEHLSPKEPISNIILMS
tara:strand:+ start:11737 stop:13359 length:1623 start_codon:yes stop_codon:yes gene_type:complete